MDDILANWIPLGNVKSELEKSTMFFNGKSPFFDGKIHQI
jgi:hypothetical protein